MALPHATLLHTGLTIGEHYRQVVQRAGEIKDVGDRLLIKATLAACKADLDEVILALQKQENVDQPTPQQNYSRDVLNRAGWFQLRGWI